MTVKFPKCLAPTDCEDILRKELPTVSSSPTSSAHSPGRGEDGNWEVLSKLPDQTSALQQRETRAAKCQVGRTTLHGGVPFTPADWHRQRMLCRGWPGVNSNKVWHNPPKRSEEDEEPGIWLLGSPDGRSPSPPLRSGAAGSTAAVPAFLPDSRAEPDLRSDRSGASDATRQGFSGENHVQIFRCL